MAFTPHTWSRSASLLLPTVRNRTVAVADLMVPLHELEELSMKVTAGLVGKEVRFSALCLGAAGEHGVVFREHSQIVR